MFIVKTIKKHFIFLCCIRIHVECSVWREDQTFFVIHIKVKSIYFLCVLRRYLVK